jgi:hypothetical protein
LHRVVPTQGAGSPAKAAKFAPCALSEVKPNTYPSREGDRAPKPIFQTKFFDIMLVAVYQNANYAVEHNITEFNYLPHEITVHLVSSGRRESRVFIDMDYARHQYKPMCGVMAIRALNLDKMAFRLSNDAFRWWVRTIEEAAVIFEQLIKALDDAEAQIAENKKQDKDAEENKERALVNFQLVEIEKAHQAYPTSIQKYLWTEERAAEIPEPSNDEDLPF